MGLMIKSAIAGLIATGPMTLFMSWFFDKLPFKERFPLPPRKITMNLARKAGIQNKLNRNQKLGLTMLSHFSYGSAVGSLFFPLMRVINLPRYIGGMIFGLLVWVVGYLFLLPLVNLHRPATRMPAGRNTLVIGAHLVWGVSLAFLYGLRRRTL